MPRAKRSRKQPLVPSGSVARILPHKATQATISKFHTLLKRKNIIKRQLERSSCPSSPSLEVLRRELDKIDSDIEDLGGLEAYQHASTLGQSSQRGGDSSKVLIKWLKLLKEQRSLAAVPLRMLEIGALKHDNYASCSKWILNTPIDLRSNHPNIAEQDFLLRPLPEDEKGQFDIISCSLVINFVPDVSDRGRMLQLCRMHLKPRPSSLLFIVLPLPCVTNSRYMTVESFQQLVSAVGFEMLQEQWKPGGKVAYWLFRWAPGGSTTKNRWSTKHLVNDGPGRNNFSIILPNALESLV